MKEIIELKIFKNYKFKFTQVRLKTQIKHKSILNYCSEIS